MLVLTSQEKASTSFHESFRVAPQKRKELSLPSFPITISYYWSVRYLPEMEVTDQREEAEAPVLRDSPERKR